MTVTVERELADAKTRLAQAVKAASDRVRQRGWSMGTVDDAQQAVMHAKAVVTTLERRLFYTEHLTYTAVEHATWVRDVFGWHTVISVAEDAVTVGKAPWFERIPFDQIVEIR